MKSKVKIGYFLLTIRNNEGRIVFNSNHLDVNEYCKVYFKNILENVKTHPEYSDKDILKSYKSLWSKFKINSRYKDSYGHEWRNTMPPDKWFLQYIKFIRSESSHNK